MAKVVQPNTQSRPRRRPALNPEARENQMINYAVDLAEKQLIEGTASSQVITHYLKLGSTKAKLEMMKLEADMKLQEAKVAEIESKRSSDEMFKKAMDAFKRYSGHADDEEDEDDDW